ncbi:hypothetical protein PYW08_010314 [Mythimna loreyi]|uniref:Uncharacterized protein n=1 Tax=Mythimna loreyi TaxID=667449 RepID=A0ACC2Q622_9NEOP|nr:hypothetical protein PYW08_010314 [Mythimna loreyi]
MEQSSEMSHVTIDEQFNNTHFNSEIDPLGEIGTQIVLDTKPKFYRLNDIVFAEPLKSATNEENSSKNHDNENEIKIIDNIVICKDPTKIYKKYHIDFEDRSTTIKCPQLNCHHTFATKNRLLSHIRRVHCADRNRYICEQCGRGFPERYLLARHADSHSADTVQCPVCGVQLRLRTSLATHLRSHSNERRHKCEICQKSFARASSKTTHVKFVHREGLLECEECDKRFSSRKQWSLHRTSHRERKPI